MTSNLGSHEILSKNFDEAQAAVKDMLKEYFRPEFLNRVDDIVVFKALSEEQVKRIAEILLNNLKNRLEKQIKITLTWSDDVLGKLAAQGFDPDFGARPLRRLLSHTVETVLSREIIKGAVKEGDRVKLGVKGNEFVFATEN